MHDYQARVPLRYYEDLWREYWQPTFPALRNATWPGSAPYLALSSGTTSGTTKYIPVSPEMIRSNRHAALQSLAWYHATRPGARLFEGQMFLLGGSTDLRRIDPALPTFSGDLSGIAAREIPRLLRGFSYPSLDIALLTDWDEKLDRLARNSIGRPITLLGGVPSWLLALSERVLEWTGRASLRDVWPTLEVIVHGGTRFDSYRELFRQLAGDDVSFLETYPASEGFVAAEDPRYAALRLMTGHGVFFEFVPASELAGPDPTRHTAANLVPGVNYAVVLTTCAGLWSYVLGDTVTFDQVNPPLLRFTGRTKQFLSAFGEHLIGEEVERAVAMAAAGTHASVVDFHAGPRFPAAATEVGCHVFMIEFARKPHSLAEFGASLDRALGQLNEDYAAHRAGDLTLSAPEIVAVPRGGFHAWMRSRGQLGGQHKVPRLDNSGELTRQLADYLNDQSQALSSPDVEARCLVSA